MILVIGNGSLHASCLQALVSQTDCPVKCIETGAAAFSNLAVLCQKLGVPHEVIANKDALETELVNIRKPALVLSIHNTVIFNSACVSNRNLRIVNFHNSLLPKHPGRSAATWAIYDMDAETGITWHAVEVRVDAGGVIAQRSLPLPRSMTGIQATRECVRLGLECYREILPSLLSGDYSTSPQMGERGNLHLSTHVPNNGILNPDWPVEKMSAFLRSLDYGVHRIFEPPKALQKGVLRTITRYSVEFADDDAQARDSNHFDLTFTNRNLTVRLALAGVAD